MTSFYEGVDLLTNFHTPQQLEGYRRMLLSKTAEQSAFISKLVPQPFSALELCCGNGRLLIDLARQGALQKAAGVDVAESRIEFAKKWAEDLGLQHVQFQAGDILGIDGVVPAGYDTAVCITGAFQYFNRAQAYDVLDLMYGQAKTCVLELYNVPTYRLVMLQVGGWSLKEWDVLPPEDPYAYYLSNYVYDQQERMMVHDKVFIHREGRIDDGRSETLYYYEPAELGCVLGEVGYKQVDIYCDWKGTPYTSGLDTMVVVGRV